MISTRSLELFAGFLYLILPFAYFEITQDPEITVRFLLISSFTTLFAIFIFLRSKSTHQQIEISPLTLAFASYLAISVLAIPKSINTGDAIYESGKIVVWLIVLVFLSLILKKSNGKNFTLPFIVALSALLFLTVGIFQYIDFQSDEKITKLDSRIVSLLSNKNFFAETLLLMLPFPLYLLTSENKLHKWVALITILLIIPFIFYIQSVASIIALVFFIIVSGGLILMFRKNISLFIFSGKQNLLIILFTLILFSLPVALLLSGKINTHGVTSKFEAAKTYFKHPDEIFNASPGTNDNSLYDRVFLLKNSIQIFKEHPLTGAGIANWKILLPKYGLYGTNFMSLGRVRFEHPHNDYVFILCETGIIGLVLWLSVLGLGFYIAFQSIKYSEDNYTKLYMILMIGNLVSFATLSIFSYPKERFFSMLLLLTSLALIATSNSKLKSFKMSANTFLIAAIVLCSIITFINLDRYKSEISLYKAFHFQKRALFNQMQNYTESAISPFYTLDQTGTPLNWYLGQSFYYQNNTQKAFENYLAASKQNPFHMQVLNDLGAMYESQGNHIKAIECFNRVFAINPDFVDSKYNLVAVYFNSGETEKAYNYLRILPGKNSLKWKEQMQTILFSKTEKLIQESQDTVLLNLINQQIKNKPSYLLDLYYESEQTGLTYEKQLISLKESEKAVTN